MAASNAHETYWNVPNAITDLGAVRSLFPLVIATSAALGLDATARAQWQTILDDLVPYPTDGNQLSPVLRPGGRQTPQRRERRLRAHLALRRHRHRRARLRDGAQHLEEAAFPLRQRLGERRDPGGAARASATTRTRG